MDDYEKARQELIKANKKAIDARDKNGKMGLHPKVKEVREKFEE